jgi:hypothetical protein
MDDDHPHQQIVAVFGQLADVLPYDQPVYRRTIQTRPVTFNCQCCGRTVTQQRFPGPIPRYCGDWCRVQAQRARTRERVQRFWARHRDADPDRKI